MTNSKNITIQILLLVFVFALMGALFSYQNNLNVDLSIYLNPQNNNLNGNNEIINYSSSNNKLIEVSTNKIYTKSNSNGLIVTNKFTGSIENGDKIITKTNSGSLYNVKKGTVLVDDTLISSNGDNYLMRTTGKTIKVISSNN